MRHPEHAHSLWTKAKEFERQMDVRQAIRAYEDLVALEPSNEIALSHCSKAWSDAIFLADIKGKHREALTKDAKEECNRIALAYSEKAIQANPNASLPHVAASFSMARLVMFSDNRTKVKRIKTARDHAVTALRLDPLSDIAHVTMGRWHWEMAQLKRSVRALVRLAYGKGLPRGSRNDAVQSYIRAVELSPQKLVNRVELGRAYYRIGRQEDARKELELATTLDVVDINAHLQKAEAERLLEDMRLNAHFHLGSSANTTKRHPRLL